jgi:hypothetical protein
MKRIVKLYEEYVTSPECVISDLFTKLENEIENWFESSDKGNSVTVSKTIGAGLVSLLHIDMETDEANYTFEVVINVDMMEDNKIVTCTFVSKKYDSDAHLISSGSEDIDPVSITEEYLLNKISELDSNESGKTKLVEPVLPIQKGSINDDLISKDDAGPKDNAPPSEMFTV